MLSLVSISSIKIAEHMISNVVRTKEFFCPLSVAGKVEKGIMSLKLPHTLEEKIKKLTKPLISEVHLYHYYMLMCSIEHGIEFSPNFRLKPFFTMEAKLDYKSSTRELVLDKNLDIKIRVFLACKFCFEEEVLVFWKSQPDILRNLTKQGEMTFLTYWLNNLEKTEEPLENFFWKDFVLLEFAFLTAVDDINLEAAEYFLKKMAAMPNDKKISILRTARASFYPNDLPEIVKSIFILKMKYFLAKSQLQECIISLKNVGLKKVMLKDKYYSLNDKYVAWKNKMMKNETEMLKNKKLGNENEMFNNENNLKNENEMLNNEHELLKNEYEMLNNEFETSVNDFQIMENECDMLLNEMSMLTY